MRVEDAVHQQDIIAFLLGLGDVGVLFVDVSGVQIDDVLVLVGLQSLDLVAIVVQLEVLSFSVFQQSELHSALAEFLLGQHTVLDENLDVVPLLLKLRVESLRLVSSVSLAFRFPLFAFRFRHLLQLVGHLLADVLGNFLHIAVALQVAAAHVQRDVRAVEHAVQQHQVFGHHALDAVGYKHLIAIQLYLVAVGVDGLAHLREIEYARQVEGIVDIQMYLEQRIFEVHRVQFVVELLVVLVGQRRRGLLPGRVGVVDDARHLLFDAFRALGLVLAFANFLKFSLAVHPLALFAKTDGHRHKAAVFLQQLQNLLFLKEFLAVVGDVQNDVRAAFFALAFRHFERRAAVAAPVHCRSVFPAFGLDFNLVGHHKRRIEAQSKVAYQVLLHVFILVQEVVGAAKGYLVDVLVDLLLGHSDAAVADYQLFLVDFHLDGQVAQLALELAARRQGLQLLRGIYSIGNQFAKKNLVVRIEELFDDRENVLGLNIQIAIHRISFLFLFNKCFRSPKLLLVDNCRNLSSNFVPFCPKLTFCQSSDTFWPLLIENGLYYLKHIKLRQLSKNS